jgi:PIN domain nuclease of toxin-antitoxin system
MRALIDTSVFLWTISGSDRLSDNAHQFIANLENDILLSVVSLWEIAIKTSLGKLELLLPFNQLIPEQLEQNAITVLPVELGHLSGVTELPFHHRDPFDRLIIAQGLTEQIPVITKDKAFSRYSVQLIW